MARSLIGLDVGTNAVTVAEVVIGEPPRLAAFGQVALPRDAMRDGEVVDGAAVAEAIRRLRGEVGIRRGGVRVGLASPRLIVRQVEMPVMSDEDLAGALRFQAADLIPFSIDEAFTDFAILDQYQPPDGEPVMRVLLAAAQRGMVEQLVEAVESGGFAVDAVDLIPLALLRSLGARSGFAGAEGIVSIGGGTSVVAVHENGVPRFVRVLGSGGRQLTDAIASSLDLMSDAAESLKRQLANGVGDPTVDQARAAIDRPLGVLLDEVRSSIDYYRNQPGAAPLSQVLVTGGSAQLAGLIDRLGGLLGVSTFAADPRSHLTIGDIGFAPEELPRLDPYLPAAVGLALADPARGPVMNLLPGGRKAGVGAANSRTKLIVAGVAGAAVLAAALAYPVMQRRDERDKVVSETEDLVVKNAQLQTDIAGLQDVAAKQVQLEALQGQVQSVLANDVSWWTMLHEIAQTMPNDVWLTNFSGQVDRTAVAPPAPTTGRAALTTTTLAQPGSVATPTGTLNGTITVEAVGLDFPAVAGWIDGIFELIKLDGVWVSTATKSQVGANTEIVQYTSNARLTDAARSDRAEERTTGGAQ